MKNNLKKWDVVWINLDPTMCNEMKKTRPCIIVSPSAINKNLNTITIVPLSTNIKELPTRVTISHNNKQGSVCIEQVRTVTKERIVSVDKYPVREKYRELITQTLFEYFK
jgi:mRNA interferase MazF